MAAAGGALLNTHVKLLAVDLLSLTQTSSSSSSSFSLRGILLSRAESVGTVTSRELKPERFLRFTLDDGTGCVHCILWLNHRAFDSSAEVSLVAAAAGGFADVVRLGRAVRVRGQITKFRGVVQITVSDVLDESDANAEILHWLECIHLARNCYHALPPFKSH